MKSVLILVSLFFGLGLVCYVVNVLRKYINRPHRLIELKEHITSIKTATELSVALEHFNEAHYIIEHYDISLADADYHGSLAELRLEASGAASRSKDTS